MLWSKPLDTVALVPLKKFSNAKSRLRDTLDEGEVETLALALARGVLEALRPKPTIVVCDDPGVSDFASGLGVEVVFTNAHTLNGAVSDAYSQLGNYEQVIVVHGDLQAPDGLGLFQPPPGITIVTDHHQKGTNVLALPTGLDFNFSYGPRSAQLHQEEAERLGLPYLVITNSPWRFDLDEPSDLRAGPNGT